MSLSHTHTFSSPLPPLPVSDAPVDQRGGQSCSVTASFTNPLKKTLTNVVFYIEGAQLTQTAKMEGKWAKDIVIAYQSSFVLTLLPAVASFPCGLEMQYGILLWASPGNQIALRTIYFYSNTKLINLFVRWWVGSLTTTLVR